MNELFSASDFSSDFNFIYNTSSHPSSFFHNGLQLSLPEAKSNKLIMQKHLELNMKKNLNYTDKHLDISRESKSNLDESNLSNNSLISAHPIGSHYQSISPSSSCQDLKHIYNNIKLCSPLICTFPFFFDSSQDEFNKINNASFVSDYENQSLDNFEERRSKRKYRNLGSSYKNNRNEISNSKTIKNDKYKNLFFDFFFIYHDSSNIDVENDERKTHNFNKSYQNISKTELYSPTNSNHDFISQSYESKFHNTMPPFSENIFDPFETEPFYNDKSNFYHSPINSIYNKLSSFSISHIIPENTNLSSSNVHSISELEESEIPIKFCVPITRIPFKTNSIYESMPDYCPNKPPIKCIPRSMACRFLPEQFPDARFLGGCPINSEFLSSENFRTAYSLGPITTQSLQNLENQHRTSNTERIQHNKHNSNIWSLRFSRIDGFIWEEICELHHFGIDYHLRNIWTLEFIQIGSMWDYFITDSLYNYQDGNLELDVNHFSNQFPSILSLNPSTEFESSLIRVWENTINAGALSTIPDDILRELRCIQKEYQLEQEEKIEKNINSKADLNLIPQLTPSFLKANSRNPSSPYENRLSYIVDNNRQTLLKKAMASQIQLIQNVLDQIEETFKDSSFVSSLKKALEVLKGQLSVRPNPKSRTLPARTQTLFSSTAKCHDIDFSSLYKDKDPLKLDQESLTNPWEILQKHFSSTPTSTLNLINAIDKRDSKSDTKESLPCPDFKAKLSPKSNSDKSTEVPTSKRARRAASRSFFSPEEEMRQLIKDFASKNELLFFEFCDSLKLNQNELEKFISYQLDLTSKPTIRQKVYQLVEKLEKVQPRTKELEDRRTISPEEPFKTTDSIPSKNSHTRSKLSGDVLWVHLEDCPDLEHAKQKVIRNLGYKYLHTGKTTNRYVRNYTCNRHKGCRARSRIINDNLTGRVWIETWDSHIA